MKKSVLAIEKIRSKHSNVTYEQMKVSDIITIEICDDRYRFKNGRKSMLLYFDSFDTHDRFKYKTDSPSSKLVGDMIIHNYISNVVGYSTYYPHDGDIFCESGCVYTKSNEVLLVTLVDLADSNDVIVINKRNINHELVKYILKCYTSNMWMYSSIVIGNPWDYIKSVNRCRQTRR